MRPMSYFAVAAAGLLFAMVLNRRNFTLSSREHTASNSSDFLFLLSIAIVLLLARWPVIFYDAPLNVDESQASAQALRLAKDLIPWRSIDAITVGPIYSGVLLVLHEAGLPIGYITLHVLNYVILVGVLTFSFLTVRRLYGGWAARGSVLPVVGLLCSSLAPDLSHYSSELVPVFLISLGIFLVTRGLQEADSSFGVMLGAGICLGAVPFAKLQATVLAFLVVAFTLIAAIRLKRNMIPFAVGLMLPPSAILCPVILAGHWQDFWESYIQFGLNYRHSDQDRTEALFKLIAYIEPLTPFLVIAFSIVAIGVVLALRRGAGSSQGKRLRWLATLTLLFASCYAVWVPGSGFPHYIILTFPPIILASGVALSELEAGLHRLSARARRLASLIIFTVMFGGPFVSLDVGETTRMVEEQRVLHDESSDPVAAEIAKHARPGEFVAIWGWEPRYWVQTGTIPATRDGNGHLLAFQVDSRVRARYLQDFLSEPPVVFVDAVTKGAGMFDAFLGSKGLNHEDFPALAKVIQERYDLMSTIPLSPDSSSPQISLQSTKGVSTIGLRIYARRAPK